MKHFNKILCPLDFSDASRHAFEHAQVFAKAFKAELEVMHVSPNLAEAYTALMPDFPGYGPESEEDLLQELNEFTGDWSGKIKKVIRTGTPYIEILEYAEQNRFDLIVLGAKGLSRFERLFLGSTGEKVTRKANCPVLTVRPRQRVDIKRILVPIDFSPLSYAVLPMVASIAKRFKAEIYLLHVVEIGHRMDREGQLKEYEYFEKVKKKLAQQWELPEEFSRIETKKFVRHHHGSPGYGILEFAQDWDIDLIAMATHGRSGFSRALLGSVTEKVLKIASCPVLSVRSELQG